MNVGYIFPFVR